MWVVLYVATKLAAYCGWCYYGVLQFRPETVNRGAAALGFGLLRLLMGLFFGAVIYLASSFLAPVLWPFPGGNVLTYASTYVPTRWVEWTLMAMFITPGSRSLGSWLFGWNRASRLWRLGGIGISCLADLPIIAAAGWILPLGRFMC
jgi:hypothetical protein